MGEVQGHQKNIDHIKKIQGFEKNSERCCGNCFNVLYEHEKITFSCEIGYFEVEAQDHCKEWIKNEK